MLQREHAAFELSGFVLWAAATVYVLIGSRESSCSCFGGSYSWVR